MASVTSVHDDLDREYTDDDLVDADDYTFYPEHGILELDAGVFQDGTRNVKIVYIAGYSTIPDDLAHAAIVWTAASFNRAGQGADGLADEHLGDYSARYALAPIPPEAESILNAYRETVV